MEIQEEKVDSIAPVVRAESGSSEERTEKGVLSQDEYHLAKLGYKQEFFRNLGLFENWAATFTVSELVVYSKFQTYDFHMSYSAWDIES